MNKIVLGLMLAALIISLCACGDRRADKEETQNEAAPASAESTEAPPAAVIATAVTGEVEMEYCCFGSGEKVFVILPGLSIKPVTPSAEALAQGFASFAEKYTVYLFDRRTNIPPDYSIDEMAEDTVAVMRSLGIEQACFFGASQGGMIAQSIAIHHPEMVERLVLGSTAARTNDTMTVVVEGWIKLAEEHKGYELNRAVSEAIYSEATFTAYRDYLLAAGNDITDEELDRFVVMASSIRSLALYDGLEKIGCETLVLGCEGDKVTTPEAAREIADRLGCEAYFYGEEYGHAVFDEAPDYRGRILEFIDR